MSNRSRIEAYLLFIPQLILTVIIITGIVNGMVQSFGIIPSLGLKNFSWSYYLEVWRDPQLSASAWFTLRIAFISATLSLIIGLGIIYLWLSHPSKTDNTESILRIPIVIPHIIVCLFVVQLFNQSGLLARLINALGYEESQKLFSGILFRPSGWGIILAYLWKEIPFVVFYCLPMLMKVSQHLGEAGRTLGASPRQEFRYIILPLAKKTIFSAYFIIFNYTLASYEVPALLGPTLPKSLPQMTYQAFTHPDLKHRPYAMAMNGYLLALSLLTGLLIFVVFFCRDFIKKRKGRGVNVSY